MIMLSKQELLERLEKWESNRELPRKSQSGDKYDRVRRVVHNLTLELIKHTPSVDAEPIHYANWDVSPFGLIYCNSCLHSSPSYENGEQVKTNFCSNCGARMFRGVRP